MWGGTSQPSRKRFHPSKLWQSAVYEEALKREPPSPDHPDTIESSCHVVHLPDSVCKKIYKYFYLPPLPLDGGWGKQQWHIKEYKMKYQLCQHYLVWPHPSAKSDKWSGHRPTQERHTAS